MIPLVDMTIDCVLSVNVFVDQLDAVAAFYVDGLSLPLSSKSASQLSFYYGMTSLNIHQASDADRHSIGRPTGLGLRTRHASDVDQIVKRLRTKFTSQANIATESWARGTRVNITDPANNQLTIWGTDDPNDDEFPHLFEGPSIVTIPSRDLRRSLGFYYGVLQLPMMEQPNPQTAIFFHDGCRLIVTANDPWSPAPPTTGESGVCLSTTDLDGLVHNLEHHGISLAEPITGNSTIRGASVRDPDGNLLTLLSQI
jgi:predicted enzyme related to lactoylglutathione lyase